MKPDADNIAKIILDALNEVAWDDDAQVVQLSVCKRYDTDPCVIVTIEDVLTEVTICP
jgi:Holliday junction resolvase RusA-like endonuclease